MKAPVVLFVYNRIDHTKKILEALSQNTLSRESELFIFADGAANETEEKRVAQVRKYLDQFADSGHFRRVEIVKAEKNKGLESSIIDGVTRIINQYGKAIVLEDDIYTAPDFLTFMNQALDYYEKDTKVWSVSGRTLDTPKTRKGKRDVYFTYRGECAGWASWADRWNRIDWSVADFDEFRKDKRRQRQFNQGGRDMTMLLEKQQKGEIRSWAIRWCYQQFKEQMITIFPKHPKSVNIGYDGSGTNCSNDGNKEVTFVKETEWDFRYDPCDKLLVREFQKDYRKKYYRQELGRYWYSLTEYEHCLVYHAPVYKKIHPKKYVLKPSFREWYAEPMPFYWKGTQYVFVEIFDKLKRKSCLGVSRMDENGILQKPQRIIEESFSMSFPSVFSAGGEVYMVPECEKAGQIRIYKMGQQMTDWKLVHQFTDVGRIVDTVAWKEGDSFLLLGSRLCEENPKQARRVLYRLTGLGEKEAALSKCWEDENDSYDTRNGGNLVDTKEGTLRIVRHSTKDIFGKFVTIKHILKLDDSGLQEMQIERIDLAEEKIPLPAFVYRPWGISAYGRDDEIEIMDVLCQRFSPGGLFMKVYRKIKG